MSTTSQSCHALRTFGVLALIVLLSGCTGFNCPVDRPSCCDNVLFGCNQFEMPQGCSCDDYFSQSYTGMKLQRSTPLYTKALKSVGGTWRVSLTKSSSGCDYLGDRVVNTLVMRERRRRVNVKLPGVTTLTGLRFGAKVRARGNYRTFFPRCSADIRTSIHFTDASNASVVGSVTTQCSQPGLSCSVTYQGSARRL